MGDFQVAIGGGFWVAVRGRVNTEIYNEPVSGRVMVRRLNLDGDGQADLTVHGGAYKAVYVYDVENINYWREELGRDDLGYGQFGENFYVKGSVELGRAGKSHPF